MDQWKSHRLHTIKYRVCVATRRYAQHRFLDSRLGYGTRRRRDRARSRAVVAREHTLLDGARGAINRLRVVRTVDTPEEPARGTRAKNPREEPARGTRARNSLRFKLKSSYKNRDKIT